MHIANMLEASKLLASLQAINLTTIWAGIAGNMREVIYGKYAGAKVNEVIVFSVWHKPSSDNSQSLAAIQESTRECNQ